MTNHKDECEEIVFLTDRARVVHMLNLLGTKWWTEKIDKLGLLT